MYNDSNPPQRRRQEQEHASRAALSLPCLKAGVSRARRMNGKILVKAGKKARVGKK